MNTHAFFRKIMVVVISAAGAVVAVAQSGFAPNAPPAPPTLGVYDSRAVAVAYAGSTFQVRKMKAMVAQLQQARKAGDTNAVSQLEAKGRAWQLMLQQQGFGTAPVDDILGEISAELSAIQEEVGATRLISIWNEAELEQYPDAAPGHPLALRAP